MADYPTNQQLKQIGHFPFAEGESLRTTCIRWFFLIQDLWVHSNGTMRITRRSVELHTGGWSENEVIVRSMKKHPILWSVTWKQSNRGGHFYFELPKKEKKNERA